MGCPHPPLEDGPQTMGAEAMLASNRRERFCTPVEGNDYLQLKDRPAELSFWVPAYIKLLLAESKHCRLRPAGELFSLGLLVFFKGVYT